MSVYKTTQFMRHLSHVTFERGEVYRRLDQVTADANILTNSLYSCEVRLVSG